VLHGVTC